MIYLKTSEDIERMREANTLVSRTLGEIAKWVAPGVTTLKLDTIAREFICDNGGRPACLGYGGFPGTICAEVNEVVVHGFPSNYITPVEAVTAAAMAPLSGMKPVSVGQL